MSGNISTVKYGCFELWNFTVYMCNALNKMFSQYSKKFIATEACVDEAILKQMFTEFEDLQLKAGEVIVTLFDLGNSIVELGDDPYKAVFQNTETMMDVKTRFCTDLLTDDDDPNGLALFASRNGRTDAIENDKTLKDFAKHRHVRLWVSISRR